MYFETTGSTCQDRSSIVRMMVCGHGITVASDGSCHPALNISVPTRSRGSAWTRLDGFRAIRSTLGKLLRLRSCSLRKAIGDLAVSSGPAMAGPCPPLRLKLRKVRTAGASGGAREGNPQDAGSDPIRPHRQVRGFPEFQGDLSPRLGARPGSGSPKRIPIAEAAQRGVGFARPTTDPKGPTGTPGIGDFRPPPPLAAPLDLQGHPSDLADPIRQTDLGASMGRRARAVHLCARTREHRPAGLQPGRSPR